MAVTLHNYQCQKPHKTRQRQPLRPGKTGRKVEDPPAASGRSPGASGADAALPAQCVPP